MSKRVRERKREREKQRATVMDRLCHLQVKISQVEKEQGQNKKKRELGSVSGRRKTSRLIEGMVSDLQADKLCPPVTPPVLEPVGHGEHLEA